MEHKYINIERLRPRHSSGFQPGDHIVVQEKIDGSNFQSAMTESRTGSGLLDGRVSWMRKIICVVHGAGRRNRIRKR